MPRMLNLRPPSRCYYVGRSIVQQRGGRLYGLARDEIYGVSRIIRGTIVSRFDTSPSLLSYFYRVPFDALLRRFGSNRSRERVCRPRMNILDETFFPTELSKDDETTLLRLASVFLVVIRGRNFPFLWSSYRNVGRIKSTRILNIVFRQRYFETLSPTYKFVERAKNWIL